MLQATKQWQWIACANKNRLLLDLNDDMQLCTPYKLRQLTDCVFKNPRFSLEDAAFYEQVYNYLDGFELYKPALNLRLHLAFLEQIAHHQYRLHQ